MIDLKKYAKFFKEIGAADVSHTDKTYLAHVVAVANDLKLWGCNDHLQLAGLFHSVYGTQQFQRFTLPLEKRDEIRTMIGERAERLAYWNCAMQRETFDDCVLRNDGVNAFDDRITGARHELSEQEFTDLMTLHLCDWLEQAPRSQKWDYRRAAYRGMAERLGGVALQSFDRVYSLEQAPSE